MKMIAATFDEDQEPATFTMTMSVQEMALVYAFVGHVSPAAVTETSGSVEWGNVLYDLADAVGIIGNTFYDDGWRQVSPALHPIHLRPALS